MITTIIFLLVLTVLVFIHELGHFLAARLFKIRVDEFAIGFPPRIWSVMRKGTRFAINLIPLGGYVKIHGEGETDELTPDSMLAKPRWQQAVVLVAGVTFNIVLTWLLLSSAFMMGTQASVQGFPTDKVSDRSVAIMFVSPGSPAEKAGIKSGDTIVSVSNTVVHLEGSGLSVPLIQSAIADATGEVTFVVHPEMNMSTTSTIVVTPETGVVMGKKAVGISMDEVGVINLGFFESFVYGAKSTYALTTSIVTGLYDFFAQVLSPENSAQSALQSVSGPVGIASIVGASASRGFSALLVITAVISANLAVLNLAPFPALDGGRLVVVGIEGMLRRRLNPKIIGWVNAIGFLLLIGLMIVVTFKDIFALVK
jgi:regulator of sigma E protease